MLVRRRRDRGRDHARARAGAEAAARVRPLLRDRRRRAHLAPPRPRSASRCWIPAAILSAYWVPSDGIAKAVRIVTALAREREGEGRRVRGRREGHGVRPSGRTGARRCRPTAGDIECERVLICAGIWGPTVGAMAGVPIPLVAVQHQLVWTEPIPELAGETREVAHPILRHQDMSMYFRHREDHYAVGNYRHEPIATPQSAIRRAGRGRDAGDHAVHARGLHDGRGRGRADAAGARGAHAAARTRPARSTGCSRSRPTRARSSASRARRARRVGVRGRVGDARRRDGAPGRRVDGLGRALDGSRPRPTPTASIRSRRRRPTCWSAAGSSTARSTTSCIRSSSPSGPRKIRLSPFYAREAELGAEFFTGAGWERPQWFEQNRALVPEDAVWAKREGWAARCWSPAVGAEHLATRERVGLFDITAFAKFDVVRDRARSPTWSGSARTGSTGRSAPSSTRRC